ncbi:MAG: substrate-binding domain-containing protein, partial [Pseudomonadota bacterium]
MQKKLAVAAVALASFGVATAAQARDEISIVGSSTVFPFTSTVIERFAQVSGGPAPIIESTGTGGGMRLFCGGV